MEQKDIQKLIHEKDQYIRKLQYKIDKLQKEKQELIKASSSQGSMNNFYKQKLQIQISQNEKAMELFINISHRMLKINELMKSKNELNDDSSDVKNLIGLIGDENELSAKIQNIDLDRSDSDNMQTIQSQVTKKMQQLETVCDVFHKSFIKIQKEVKGFQKKLNDTRSHFEDQLRSVNKQLKQARQGKQHLTTLLEKNQDEKNQILWKIQNALDPSSRKQVESMEKSDLVQHIKKLVYKAKQLQTSKLQVIKQNKKIKTADLEKYKKILNEVKEVKEMSRMGKSMV